ncbi:NAD/NADP octopine/nopaline dehydrogenase family protein [Roseococcus sp. YIM B11640]|uniref:NAD/NADP-dependent octopine/nopaline dehydrogenase family protein n=1 Tax=Roseococcus sp. YIM B11640 TaxID=3133973 RepID=UPI003C7B1E04
MRIAVLGGGNGSFAAAADLALAGHEVRLWRRDSAAVAAHIAAGGHITVLDAAGIHEALPHLITDDLGTAVHGAELILCPTPATAQPDIARRLVPLLQDGQVVYLPPGTLGSVLMAQALHRHRPGASVAFAETGTLPWLVRKRGPQEIAITIRAKRLPTGVFPEALSRRALGVIRQAFPDSIEDCGDALSAALMNAGPIIHPPLIVMNAGPLEHFPKWDIHNEGTQPAIRRTTDALDLERIAIRAALGYGPPHFPLANHYATEGEEWMYGRRSHDRLTESGDWRERILLQSHRYMMEDTRLGLSLLISAADLAGVEAPLARGFSAIGAAIRGDAPDHSGRTLADVGLGGLSRDELRQVLHHGF